MFPAYSSHVGDHARGQQRGKVGVVLVHGYLRNVFDRPPPGRFQGFEVAQEAFLFVDVDGELGHVVRQGVRVQNEGLHGTVRVPYSRLPVELVRVEFFKKVFRNLEETPLFVSVFCERSYQVSGLRQVGVEDKVLHVRAGVLPLEREFFADSAGLVVSPGLFQVATEVTLREFFKAHLLFDVLDAFQRHPGPTVVPQPTAGHFVRSMRQIWRAIPGARE